MQSALEIFTRTRGTKLLRHTHSMLTKRRFHCCTEFASPQAPSAIVSFSWVLHPEEFCLRVMSTAAQPLSGCRARCSRRVAEDDFQYKAKALRQHCCDECFGGHSYFLHVVRPSLLIWNRLSIHAQ